MSSIGELRGVWQATAVTVSGQEIPRAEIGLLQLTLTRTRFTTSRGEETLFDSSYTADPTTSPMQIEMVGSGGDFEGQAALGIYDLEGETLRICYAMPGFGRPREFASAPGSGAFLIVLRRVIES